MNVLLISPKIPDTFWSFSYALSFIGKKSAFPPLALMTVAALLQTPPIKNPRLIWNKNNNPSKELTPFSFLWPITFSSNFTYIIN